MCTSIRKQDIIYHPRMVIPVVTRLGPDNMMWSMMYGMNNMVNLRSEKLYTYWKDYVANRCIIEMDTFYEKGIEFKLPYPLLLGGLYSKAQRAFAILTKDATPEVAQVHHRMPLIVNADSYYFLNQIQKMDLSVFNNIPALLRV